MSELRLDHLRIFVLVAQTGSFSKSATILGTTQPKVSRVISALEANWQAPLFRRTGRGVTLSSHGEAAMVRALDLLRSADQLSDDIRSHGGAPSGHVSLGLPRSLIAAVVPPLFAQLRAERPGIRLQLVDGFGEQMTRWIADGLIDIGVHSKYHEVPSGTEAETDSHFVLAGPGSLGVLAPTTDFRDLAKFPLALPSSTNDMRALLERVARHRKIALDIVVESESLIAQRELLRNGLCFTILASQNLLEIDFDRGCSVSRIVNPAIGRTIVVDTVRRGLSAAGEDVLARLVSILRKTCHMLEV